MMISRMKYLLMITLALSSAQGAAMEALTDGEMASITGQALFVGNHATRGGHDFYRMGLDVEVELNANIGSLKLGCGGINGPGACDIDIDHLSLSGNCATRASCSAVLTRPYVEFAIRNDTSKTQREIVGFRFSAENALGLLTAGENTNTPNGINTISGYMRTTDIHGRAWTEPVNLGGMTDPNRTVLQFDTNPDILLCTKGCFSGNTATADPATSLGVNIPSLPVDFAGAGAFVYGNRQTSTTAIASGPVPVVSLNGGQLNVKMEETISVLFFISVSEATVNIQGSVGGLEAEFEFTQDLGLIHKIEVDSPFYLAFQSENVHWPGAPVDDIALPGWWMGFADPVELGALNPAQQVSIVPTFNQMADAFRNYFEANPIPIGTNQGLQQLFSGEMTVNVGALTISETLFMTVQDLPLDASQDVAPNCWGGGGCFL